MVELQRGISHLIQQYNALLKKNLILSWRHKRSTVIHLFSSFFFVFLILCIEKSINSRFSSTTASKNIFDPKTVIFPPIPPCEEKFFVKRPCFDFAWSGSASTRIQSIVQGIMDNNPGRKIPTSKVLNDAYNWSPSTGRKLVDLHYFKGGRVSCIASDPKSGVVAVANGEGQLLVYATLSKAIEKLKSK